MLKQTKQGLLARALRRRRSPGRVDVIPAQRRDVREKSLVDVALSALSRNGALKGDQKKRVLAIDGIPAAHDGRCCGEFRPPGWRAPSQLGDER